MYLHITSMHYCRNKRITRPDMWDIDSSQIKVKCIRLEIIKRVSVIVSDITNNYDYYLS